MSQRCESEVIKLGQNNDIAENVFFFLEKSLPAASSPPPQIDTHPHLMNILVDSIFYQFRLY